jgi:phosphate transport system substrate-binding protein
MRNTQYTGLFSRKLFVLAVIFHITAVQLVCAAAKRENDEYNYLRNESVIRCTTTPSAYERLLNGEADIIFCTKPSDEQLEMARQMDKTYKLTPIGKEAFVFFVNSDNPVANVTTQAIQNIYSGEAKNWKEISDMDNMDKEIIAYQRPQNSGSQTILNAIGYSLLVNSPTIT